MSASVDLPDTGTGKSLRFEGKKGVTVMIQTVPCLVVRVCQPNVLKSLSAPSFSGTGHHP